MSDALTEVYGDKAGQEAGKDYLRYLAKRQAESGGTYLDINVDEFSTDVEERVKLMKWTVQLVQESVSIPMSIDSSNLEILRAGLSACDRKRGAPMLNSVSLERTSAVELAAPEEAAAVMFTLGHPDQYRFLVKEQGWSADRWARWVQSALVAALLAPPYADGDPREEPRRPD